MYQSMFLMIGFKEEKKNLEVVKGGEVVDLECVFTISIKKIYNVFIKRDMSNIRCKCTSGEKDY